MNESAAVAVMPEEETANKRKEENSTVVDMQAPDANQAGEHSQKTTQTADVARENLENKHGQTSNLKEQNENATATGMKDENVESEQNLNDEHSEHVTYSEDGTAIYTDPKTNYRYKWCTKENKWIPDDATTADNAYENEHYKWCNETQKWIPKQSPLTETEHYKWDAEKNQWVPKMKEAAQNDTAKPSEIVYDIDDDGQRTYTDKDGVVFFWDTKMNAWFPKIDEDFMARYQMNYGFIDNTSVSEKEQEKRNLELAAQKEKELAQLIEEAKANEVANKQGTKRKQLQDPPSKPNFP